MSRGPIRFEQDDDEAGRARRPWPPSPVRFRHIEIHVRDHGATAEFLGNTLGVSTGDGSSQGVVLAGATTLFFQPGEGSGVAHLAFNVAAGSLDHWARRLATRTPPVPLLADAAGRTRFTFPSWRAEAVYFRGPEGHVFELIARDDAPPPSDERGIAGVSEIGIVGTDVRAFARRVEEDLGLAPYRGVSDDFAAMGDERGLLILVRANRDWFPENSEAAVATFARLELETPRPARVVDPTGLVTILGRP